VSEDPTTGQPYGDPNRRQDPEDRFLGEQPLDPDERERQPPQEPDRPAGEASRAARQGAMSSEQGDQAPASATGPSSAGPPDAGTPEDEGENGPGTVR
jgi:hypothetical protein